MLVYVDVIPDFRYLTTIFNLAVRSYFDSVTVDSNGRKDARNANQQMKILMARKKVRIKPAKRCYSGVQMEEQELDTQKTWSKGEKTRDKFTYLVKTNGVRSQS